MSSLWISLAVGIAALYAVVGIRFICRALNWAPQQELWDRSTRGLCSVCGYDLSGNVSGNCPECGASLERQAVHKAPPALRLLPERQPLWVWTIVVAAMLLAAIVDRLR